MKPLLRTVVTLSVLLAINALPEQTKGVKPLSKAKEPLEEAEPSEPQARVERCTTCGTLNFDLKSPKDVLASIRVPPGATVHTQSSYEGCSTASGCAGLKIKDGKVLERFGNVDALKAASEADINNEFVFHAPGFSSDVFNGAIPADGPFWWMNKDSPFKTGANFEKFSQSSASYTSGIGSAGAGFGGAVDLGANPFLNGEFSKFNLANSASKPSSFQSSSSYEFSQTSSNSDVDLNKNPFLNGNIKLGQAGGQGIGIAGGAGFGQASGAGFGQAGGAGFGQGAGAGFGQAGGAGFGQAGGAGFGQAGGAAFGQAGGAAFGQAGGAAFGQAGGQGFGQTGGQGFNQNGAGFGAINTSGSKFSTGYVGSSPSPFVAPDNVNVIQNERANEFNFEQQQQTQQSIDEAFQSGANFGVGNTGGDLQQTCAGAGYICAPKAQCNNGVVNSNGAGLLQASTKKQYCNVRTEICCRLETSAIGSNLNQGSGLFANAGNVNSLGVSGSSGSTGQASFGQSGSAAQATFGSGSNGQGLYGQAGLGSATGQGTFGQSGSASFGQSGSGSYSSNTLSTSSYGSKGTTFGATNNKGVTLGSAGSTGSLGFGSSGSLGFGSTGSVGSTVTPSIAVTPQSNFVDSDSFSAGSENSGFYRPGANGAGLKPGVPYLPPVDIVNSGSNVVSTAYPRPTFVTTPTPLTTPRPTYLPPSTAAPGYLPPIGEQSINRETVITPGPNYVDGSLILDENRFPQPRPRPTVAPRLPTPVPALVDIPAGCAAALKCTPIEFCTAEGVISNTTVTLSRSQNTYRVPLTDCKDLSTGRIGKCCRDPYYTDPWPVNQIGQWVPGVFGGNDGRYVPDSGISENNPRVVVTARPPVTGGILLPNFRPGTTASPGQGQYIKGGQGQFTKGGQGQFTKGGQGQFTKGGQGQYAKGGQGQTSVIGQGGFVSKGQGQVVTQGQGEIVRQGQGQIVTQGQYGQGQLTTQGFGTGLIQGQGEGVSQGFGQGVIQGGGGLVSKGQGAIVTQGSGLGVIQGQGEGVSQGFGQGIRQGGGAFVTQGFGTGVQQGGGALLTTGQGQLITEGQGALVSQGFGQGVRQGGGAYLSQGQGTLVSQGFSQGLRQGQGFVENEFGESVQRVYLQPYTVGGQCGVFNSQKPYGNRDDLEVDFAEIPWQAMILEKTNKSLLCGGVITRPDVVITSAECVDGLEAKNVLIKGGEYKLGVDEEPLPFQIVQVKTILRHPYYKAGTFHYDAAILVLAENLRFADNIYPICLPSAEETLDSFYNGAGSCIVTGWGKKVLQSHLLGSIMHSLNVSLINPGECQSKMSREYPHLLEYYDQDSCACGQPTNPANNICKVDIGSALACTTGDGHYVMRGIYSWDTGCQLGNQIGVFYKFDVEWYEWAIGLIESVRFTKYTKGSIFTGAKGTIKVGSGPSSVGSFGTGSLGAVGLGQFGNKGVFEGAKGTIKVGTSGTGVVSGSGQFGFGQIQPQFGQYSEKFGSGGTGFDITSQIKKPISNTFTYSEKVIKTEPKFVTYTTKPKYVTYTTKPEFVTYTTKPEIVTYTTKPEIVTYTTKPEIVTYTTKPEIVTFTTKPEYFTYTTKPKIITYTTKPKYVTYTSKPQFITYETSGSGTNLQYAIPNSSFKQSFSDLINHEHNAKCHCLDGKK